MRIPGVKRGRIFFRWLQARVLGGVLILGYHRISAVGDDFYHVSVSPENFAGQMEALREYAHPISLSKLVQSLEQNALPPRSVAVTFDDGYADNLYVAKPILEKYDIPATVFICTGYVGREFWWDELERLVTTSSADLPTLYSQIDRKQFRWERATGGHGVEDGRNDSVRAEFLHALYPWLLTMAPKTREQLMDMIRAWAESRSKDLSIRRALTSDELLSLADGALIEIGAHTRSHPTLTRLTVEEQTEEIVSSKQYLEDLLNKRVWAFAYPNGERTMATREILVRTGFRFACRSRIDLVRPGHDHYNLPRFWPGDENRDEFTRKLKLWI